MKKIFTLVILLSIGITQIYAQCFQCDSITKAFSIGASSATGTNSFAGGYESGTTTNATNSFVFGTNSLVNQSGGIAIGSFAKSYAINSLVFGQYVTSSGANSITIGTATSSSQLVNNKNNSIMFGVTDKPALTIVKKTGLITPIDLSLIGIGTDDPEEMVHVVGKLLIDRTETTASSLQFRYTEAGFGGNNSMPYYWDIFTDDEGLRFNTITNSVTNQAMVITKSGSIGIGKTNPSATLDVNGSFKATSADIAGTLTVNGVDLGAVNALLFQKVEELTLHIIQMENRLAELESRKKDE